MDEFVGGTRQQRIECESFQYKHSNLHSLAKEER